MRRGKGPELQSCTTYRRRQADVGQPEPVGVPQPGLAATHNTCPAAVSKHWGSHQDSGMAYSCLPSSPTWSISALTAGGYGSSSPAGFM
eukprot:SAG22_NODE_138_length_18031_cov_5.796621_19_plen_89_part_00